MKDLTLRELIRSKGKTTSHVVIGDFLGVKEYVARDLLGGIRRLQQKHVESFRDYIDEPETQIRHSARITWDRVTERARERQKNL